MELKRTTYNPETMRHIANFSDDPNGEYIYDPKYLIEAELESLRAHIKGLEGAIKGVVPKIRKIAGLHAREVMEDKLYKIANDLTNAGKEK